MSEMASRCALCGKDLSVRDVKAGDRCSDHVAMGGPGSGPQPGQGRSSSAKPGRLKAILRKVKDAAKEIGHGIVDQYHIPKTDSKGNRPEDRGTRGPISDTAKGRDPWD